MKRLYLAMVIVLLLGTSLLLQARQISRKPWSPERINAWEQSRADSLRSWDVQKYEITLSIDDQNQYVEGNVLATVFARETLNLVSYELNALNVSQVLVNGDPAPFSHNQGIINIGLNIPSGQNFTTQVFYSGNPLPSSNIYHVGMIFGTNTVFTISDPDAARQWWPCYDHPWDKAIVDLHITMRSDWKVAANGLRDSIVENGDGTSTTHWLGQYPMTTYLVCVTAGTYVEIPQMAGETPILNFVMPHQYNNAVADFASLPDIIAFFNDVFGEYPFEKYGHTVVSMSTFGAMEHQTMTTLGNYIITGNGAYELVIAHELAHQWYGNAVSFLTFKDVWLSEGFATYSEHLWTDKKTGWDAACAYVASSYHQYYLNWENSQGVRTIYDPDFNNYFSPPSYEKAASVLHMLRLKIGNDHFFQLLNQWFETYKYGNAITSEFQAMAEQISAQDLNQFFQQWIYSPGAPSLQYSVWNNDASDSPGKIIAHSTSPTATRFHIEVPFRVTHAGISDSLLVSASPNGTVNHFPQSIPPDAQISANHNHWSLLRGITELRPELVECLPSNQSVLLSWQSFMNDPSLRYNVYRRIAGILDWTLVNGSPTQDLMYYDTDVENGSDYQYCIAAVDQGGWQSMFSSYINATPAAFGFAYNLLVVDETLDGTGNSSISPTDEMVDLFYHDALQPIVYQNWDVAAQGMPPLHILGNFKVLLWHADDFSQNMLQDDIQTLSGYLLGGGKVILSGWKTAAAIPELFWSRFGAGAIPVYTNAAAFISASSDSYPPLWVDAQKMMSPWNSMLPYSYTFQDAPASLYTANMTSGAAGNGLSAIFCSSLQDGGGVLVMSGVPLYFMQPEGVRGFLQQLLPQLCPDVHSDDPCSVPELAHIDVFPNPVKGSGRLSFSLPKAEHIKISLYNIKGQLIAQLSNQHYAAGRHELNLDARLADSGSLPSGIYLIRIEGTNTKLSKRITLLK